MVACPHDKAPFGSPICRHLRDCREPALGYVKWYIGSGLEAELLCLPCAEERERGLPVESNFLCEDCFDYASAEVGYLVGVRGRPEIRIRSEPFNSTLKETPLPKQIGKIVDMAPLNSAGRSEWLMLADSGQLIRIDANSLDWAGVGSVTVPLESDHKPRMGHMLRRRLHSSGDGLFAAVVNDYGRYGEVVDLRSGKVTLLLDGGQYHPETVPFSFAFASVLGRSVAIHRTQWNRLDVSDPSSGELLSQRVPESYRSGEDRPDHYLDYFHGALYVSPGGTYILDDGWFWAPVGIPTVWSLERWISENVWESEDGPTRLLICGRPYYWDRAMCWLGGTRIAIGGIGDDDEAMIDGVTIFDVMTPGPPAGCLRADIRGAREVTAFAGPAGVFFSDGASLFSSGDTGVSRWDPEDGSRTGHLENFSPSHYHSAAREFVQLIDNTLVRWSNTS